MDGMALHLEGQTQCQGFQVSRLPVEPWAISFNLILLYMASFIIVIMSPTIHKDCLEFIKACRNNGIA